MKQYLVTWVNSWKQQKSYFCSTSRSVEDIKVWFVTHMGADSNISVSEISTKIQDASMVTVRI